MMSPLFPRLYFTTGTALRCHIEEPASMDLSPAQIGDHLCRIKVR